MLQDAHAPSSVRATQQPAPIDRNPVCQALTRLGLSTRLAPGYEIFHRLPELLTGIDRRDESWRARPVVDGNVSGDMEN